MPAFIWINKVRLENLPAAEQGKRTPGVYRVKFRAGTAAAETLPRQVNPDGSVKWSEPLEITVYDTSLPLRAAVQQQDSSSGEWSLVPGGHFEGALVTALSNDWHGASQTPTGPTFYAQLSVEMEHGTQRDTRLPPYAGLDKSKGGYRAPPTGGSAGFFGVDLFPSGRSHGRGGRGAPRMDRAASSGMYFGGAYDMGASSGSVGYVGASGSPEVYFDARSGSGAADDAGGGGGMSVGGISADLSSSSTATSLGGGILTAVAVPEADAMFPSGAPTMQRAATFSAVPTAGRRPSIKKKYSGGWVAAGGSQDGSFRRRSSISASDISSVSGGSVATAAEAEEAGLARLTAPLDGPLRSPVGTYSHSRLLDPRYQLEEEGKTEYPPQAEQEFREKEFSLGGPAFKRPSLTGARPGLDVFDPVTHETRDTEERVEEVKTERRSSDEYEGAAPLAAADNRFPEEGAEKKSWFHLRRKASRSSSSGPSGAASSPSAAGSEAQPARRRLMSMSMSASSTVSAAEEKDEELEPPEAPPEPRQASAAAKWKKPGKVGALRKILSRKRPAPPPPPSAPPAGAVPTKLVEYSELSHLRRASSLASRPPPTAPPSYQEVLRQRGWLPRPLGASAGEDAASIEHAAAVGSPADARVLPSVPMFHSAGSLMSRSFSPSAPVVPGSSRPVWMESEALSAQARSVDDEAAAALAAVAVTKASRGARRRGRRVVETSLQHTGAPTATAAAAAAAAAAPASPAPPLPAASSETGEPPISRRPRGPPVDLDWEKLLGRSADNLCDTGENSYDTGVALGGRSLPLPSSAGLSDMFQASADGEFSVADGGEEAAAPEPPVYSVMPAESMDGSGRVDADVETPSLPLYPEVRPRQRLEPTQSQTTTASSEAHVEPGFSGSRQLPRQNTSVSSEGTSISGTMLPQGNPDRAVPLPLPPAASNGGQSHRRRRRVAEHGDPVIFSSFAPPVRPGAEFDLKVVAYLRRARDAVLSEALSEGAAEAGNPEGMHIAKKKRVTVELLLPGDTFKILPREGSASRPSVRDFVWTGESHTAQFRVGCMPGVTPGPVKCEALVIEGSRVKRLSFDIQVVGPGFVPRALGSGSNGEEKLDTRMEEEKGNMAEVPFEELVFVGELGRGVQGFTSHYRWHDKDVAVKSLTSYPEFSPSEGPTRSGLEHEATILSLLGRHPNVVEFYGLCRQGGSTGDEGIYVVTKLEEGGSIEDALGLKRKSNGNGNGTNGGGRFARPTNGGTNGNGRGHGYGSEFDGHVRAAWARDVACGLANSHAAGVLHNDVASRNALLSAKSPGGRGLLCDFGLSRFLRGGVERAFCIDPDDQEKWPVRQLPRESFSLPHPLTAESDSWMYGVFLYELFEGEEPWAGLKNDEVKRLVMEGKRPPKVPEMLRQRGTHLVKLYDACLSADHEKRPSLERVVQELSTNFASMS